MTMLPGQKILISKETTRKHLVLFLSLFLFFPSSHFFKGTEMEMTSLHGYLYKQGVKGVTKIGRSAFLWWLKDCLFIILVFFFHSLYFWIFSFSHFFSGHPTQNGEKKGEIKIENITNIHTNLSFSGMKHLFGFQLEVFFLSFCPFPLKMTIFEWQTRERTFSLAALLEVEREYWVTSLFSLLSRPVPFPQETDVNPSADFIDELDIGPSSFFLSSPFFLILKNKTEGTGAVGRRGTAKTVNKCGEIGFTDATG